MVRYFQPTTFGSISSEITLKNLHLGKTELLPDSEPNPEAEVSISISYLSKERVQKDIKPLFNTPRDGYFTINDTMYYRNLNAIGNIKGGEAYYQGRLPNSYLAVMFEKNNSGFHATIETTDTYLYENRSMFTRNEKFEHFIDNVFIVLSIFANKAVMHASSITYGDKTMLFTGYPNTGKTTTSAALYRDTSNMEYVAEDMCFVDPTNLTVHSCAYTSRTLPSTKHSHSPVTNIVGLQYTPDENTFTEHGADECFRFIHRMNLYEYDWNQNIILRHLLLGEGIFNQSDVTMRYINLLKSISEKITFNKLSGNNKHAWAPLVKEYLGITEKS